MLQNVNTFCVAAPTADPVTPPQHVLGSDGSPVETTLNCIPVDLDGDLVDCTCSLNRYMFHAVKIYTM